MSFGATFRYTAKRSLAPGHTAETSYVAEFELVDAVPSVADVKTREQSQGGASEATFYRQDRSWQLTFAPVRGDDLLLLREFLDSTETGQAFHVAMYGDEAQMLALRRLETEHSESPFMRVGARDSDWFQASIVAIESKVNVVDETGAVIGSVVDESESTDIYAPEIDGGTGTGGLDPPAGSGVGQWDSPIVFEAGGGGNNIGYDAGGTGTLISGGLGSANLASFITHFVPGPNETSLILGVTGITTADIEPFTSITISGYGTLNFADIVTDTGGSLIWIVNSLGMLNVGTTYTVTVNL